MSSVDQAYETQVKNIQIKTGKTTDELSAIVHNSGLTKHTEIRDMLMRELGLGHGDANALVHYVLQSDGERAAKAKGATIDDVVSELYSGAKAGLRPIHDKLMGEIDRFGPFEIAPKKGYLSLRRKKQFAMIGPATNTRIEVGLNMKGVDATARLIELPAGGMCNYKIKVADIKEVDEELFAWVRQAYDSSG
ncbi:MAG: DUF4287 domain-containing protein [Anaerolineae bacterium]|nr:DUF4287 domain-containing protein [Anaerolineae bacterium]